jgi:hypothetical protein
MELVKYNNNSISSVTALESISSGGLNLLTTNNITSGVSSSSFTSNINSTYDTYLFKFINSHPATDEAHLTFQGSTDGGSNYNLTITSAYFLAYHAENDSEANLTYSTTSDLAQSTSYQRLIHGIGNDSDQCGAGYLWLFSPSSTNFSKQFIGLGSSHNAGDYEYNNYIAGYFNTNSAINAMNFKMSSGNIDNCVIKMYGLSKS